MGHLPRQSEGMCRYTQIVAPRNVQKLDSFESRMAYRSASSLVWRGPLRQRADGTRASEDHVPRGARHYCPGHPSAIPTLIVEARRLERLEELVKELHSRSPGLNIAIRARHSPNHCTGMLDRIVREFERGSPVIFPGHNYRRLMKVQPLMPRRLVATQVAQAARKIRSRVPR